MAGSNVRRVALALALLLSTAPCGRAGLETDCAKLAHAYKLYYRGVCYVLVLIDLSQAAAIAYCMDEAQLGLPGGTLALLPVNDRKAAAAIGAVFKDAPLLGWPKIYSRVAVTRTAALDMAAPDAGFSWVDHRTGAQYAVPLVAESSADVWLAGQPNGDGGAAVDTQLLIYPDGSMDLDDIVAGVDRRFVCQVEGSRSAGMPVVASQVAVDAKAAGGTVLSTAAVLPAATGGMHQAIDACARLCAKLTMCTSFALNENTGECRLQSATYAQTAHVDSGAAGFHWFDLL